MPSQHALRFLELVPALAVTFLPLLAAEAISPLRGDPVTLSQLPAADRTLVNLDSAKVIPTDALVTAGNGMRVKTGHGAKWPGVSWKGNWDLSAFARVEVRVRNSGTNTVTVSCRVDSGEDRNLTGGVTLESGQSDTIQVALKRASGSQLDGKLFGMRGYPAAPRGKDTIDPKNVTRLLLFVSKPDCDHEFVVVTVRATGDYKPPTAWVTDADPFIPFIDTFGQYKHKDWPGKLHSEAELQQRREAEAQALVAQPGPDGWDQYGGWATGPHLQATGFFRAEKYRDKWWLVDPEGQLFFSHGVDCVGARDTTPIAERASWFVDFPGTRPEYKQFLSLGYALKGHYADRKVECFSFVGVDLLRKYGAGWNAAYAETVHKRLRSWGLNTIANWSDLNICRMHRTPYTDAIGSHGAKKIEGGEGYWGKFPDVFDPEFTEIVRREMASKKNASAGDPWCLGYFSDNEMSWGDDTSLAVAALKSPQEQAAKKVFCADLQANYGDVARLNTAWSTAYGSWAALLEARTAPDKLKARADLTAFNTKTTETYFRIVRDAIKSFAPNQLFLGCRFAWVNDLAAIAAGKYCDVVSYNLYRRSIAEFKYPGPDKPLIVGEFHFGALDRGMFHTGLVPVENQPARAAAYREYVEGALRHPQFVGTHWFQWKDEPTTGRVYDEENYQIGLLDVADTPYAETIETTRVIGAEMYRMRLRARIP